MDEKREEIRATLETNYQRIKYNLASATVFLSRLLLPELVFIISCLLARSYCSVVRALPLLIGASYTCHR